MDEVLEMIEYSEESPSGLVWKVGGNRKVVGAQVGYRKTQVRGVYERSTWTTMIKYKSYLCHRLVWILHNGEIPEGMEIDHIDGNSLNNKISNLRCIESILNKRNRGPSLLNTTGVTGVIYWENKKGGQAYYKAQWSRLDGKRGGKYFAIETYGDELALHLASEYRRHQIDLMNLMNAGYTERHITD